MSYKVLGSCSLCGGNVCVPNAWLGIYPPDPTCVSCGAVPNSTKRTIEMRKYSDALGGKEGKIIL